MSVHCKESNYRMRDESHIIGDSLLATDLVVTHYESLPYPPFSKIDAQNEYKYYKDKEDPKPIYGALTITLDNLNHFLFHGDQSFRYVT